MVVMEMEFVINRFSQGAKDLGCTVVNIGGNDLTNANKSSILALLWQIIKVGAA